MFMVILKTFSIYIHSKNSQKIPQHLRKNSITFTTTISNQQKGQKNR
jgi:hypothetical protein